MKITSGGKNNPAPYTTTHVRVPTPIKKSVEKQIKEFKRRVESGELVLNGRRVYTQLPIEQETDFQAVLDVVNSYMDNDSTIQKSSARNKALLNFQAWLQDKVKEQS